MTTIKDIRRLLELKVAKTLRLSAERMERISTLLIEDAWRGVSFKESQRIAATSNTLCSRCRRIYHHGPGTGMSIEAAAREHLAECFVDQDRVKWTNCSDPENWFAGKFNGLDEKSQHCVQQYARVTVDAVHGNCGRGVTVGSHQLVAHYRLSRMDAADDASLS